MTPNIFEYKEFGPFLVDMVNFRKQSKRGLSMRALAKRLNRAPSLVSMFGRGERIPDPDLTQEICDALGLTPASTKYAVALNNFHRAKTVAAKTKHAEALRTMRPTSNDLLMDLDTFEVVARWHHFAILELISLPDFQGTADAIANEFDSTVTLDMVRKSLDLLQRLGFIEEKCSGTYVRSAGQVRLPTSVPSAAIRSYHKELLLRAHQAIDRQTMKERYNSSATVAVPVELIPEVGDRIKNFKNELVRFVDSKKESRDSKIYHFCVQFFRATK